MYNIVQLQFPIYEPCIPGFVFPIDFWGAAFCHGFLAPASAHGGQAKLRQRPNEETATVSTVLGAKA